MPKIGSNVLKHTKSDTITKKDLAYTCRQYFRNVVEAHKGFSRQSFDTDEDMFLPKEEVKKVTQILNKQGFKVFDAEKITDEDLEGIAESLFCGRFYIKQDPIPIDITAKELSDWRIVHVHAPLRKEANWYDRGWKHPFFEQKLHKKIAENHKRLEEPTEQEIQQEMKKLRKWKGEKLPEKDLRYLAWWLAVQRKRDILKERHMK